MREEGRHEKVIGYLSTHRRRVKAGRKTLSYIVKMALRVRLNGAYRDAWQAESPDGARRSAKDPSRGSGVARRHVQDGDYLWIVGCRNRAGGDGHRVFELLLCGEGKEFYCAFE